MVDGEGRGGDSRWQTRPADGRGEETADEAADWGVGGG